MKYCKTCHVHYDTTLEHCMLCNGELESDGNEQETYKFSECEKRKASRFFHRLFIFLNIVSIIYRLFRWTSIVMVTRCIYHQPLCGCHVCVISCSYHVDI
jgi:hypothetical protein